MNPNQPFGYADMHRDFMARNGKVLSLSHILTFYAVIGLLLTGFGLFGIAWYATRQRIREISIRKVHGATRGQIIWLLNKPVLYLCCSGVCNGHACRLVVHAALAGAVCVPCPAFGRYLCMAVVGGVGHLGGHCLPAGLDIESGKSGRMYKQE